MMGVDIFGIDILSLPRSARNSSYDSVTCCSDKDIPNGLATLVAAYLTNSRMKF